MPGLCKDPVDPGCLPIVISQIKRGTQGIHLVLPLPHMIIQLRLVLMSPAVGALVEGVGIGIDTYLLCLFLNDSLKNFLQFLTLPGILHIGPHLGRGIPQPHGGDVAGDDEVPSVLRLLHRGLHGVQETLGRQRRQRAVVGLVICLQLFCSVLQCLRYRHDFPPFLCQTLSGPPSPGLSLIISAGRQSVNL